MPGSRYARPPSGGESTATRLRMLFERNLLECRHLSRYNLPLVLLQEMATCSTYGESTSNASTTTSTIGSLARLNTSRSSRSGARCEEVRQKSKAARVQV